MIAEHSITCPWPRKGPCDCHVRKHPRNYPEMSTIPERSADGHHYDRDGRSVLVWPLADTEEEGR